MEYLSSASLAALADEGVLLIDTRPVQEVAYNTVTDSISIVWNESFVGKFQQLVADEQTVAVIATEESAPKIHKAIKATGFGGLKGIALPEAAEGFKKTVTILIEADEFAIDFNHDEFYLVDVRSNEEFEQEHLEWAESIPLEDIEQLTQELSNDMRVYVVANNTEDAFTAATLFKRNGIELVRAVEGGYEDFINLKLPIVKAKKQTKQS